MLQVYLTSTSKRLYDITESQFGDITILLPVTWAGNEECLAGRNLSISGLDQSLARGVDPDFRVVDPHPIFGAEPWIQQYGQCGSRGRGVWIPFPYLTDKENNTAKVKGQSFSYSNFLE